MSAKHDDRKKQRKQVADDQAKSAGQAGEAETQTEREKVTPPEAGERTKSVPDRTGGQNEAIGQKRNDEQQYHAGGVAHDPHNRTQERVDRRDPDAGDIDEETRSASAPYNKTYGHHA